MIILGLTGSIAMGKSTASAMLQHMGVPVHDSDAAVHDIYKYDKAFYREIAVTYPDAIKHRTIDRKRLGEIIYADPEKRQHLEELLHPKVRESQQVFLKKCRRLHQKIAVLDIPLLFETGAEKRCDHILVITAPYHTQKTRVLARPNMTEEKFIHILNSQTNDSEKRARADFIVSSGLGRKRMYQDLEKVLTALTTTKQHHA